MFHIKANCGAISYSGNWLSINFAYFQWSFLLIKVLSCNVLTSPCEGDKSFEALHNNPTNQSNL